MRCILDLYGKQYQSEEFTERQVSAFIAAACGCTGMNILAILEDALTTEAKVFREYDSIERAEKDLAYLLSKLFPTLERSVDSLDTTELITIITPMAEALNPKGETPVIPLQTAPFGEAIALENPPVLKAINKAEQGAIAYAAKTMGHAVRYVDSWYQWWKTVYDPTDGFTPAETIAVLHELGPKYLKLEDSDRYYSLITAYLESQQDAIAA
jgi:hypothetical protein